MTRTAEAVESRVVSPDGTPIAVHVSGGGRPLVVVHGTTSDHTTWRRVLSSLEPHVAVHAVDRRGRGGSGDSPDYSLAKEYADVAAVVEAAAAASGMPVDLLGHSYGGNVAFGAACLTDDIRRLVLYEGWPVPDIAHRTTPPEVLAALDAELAQGRPDQMLRTFYRQVAKVTEEDLAMLEAGPTWPARVAAAPTVPREVRAFGVQAFDPGWAARISVPVLLLVGSDSPDDIKADPDVVASALPDARIHVLEGQEHLAYLTAPEMFAQEVLSFLRE